MAFFDDASLESLRVVARRHKELAATYSKGEESVAASCKGVEFCFAPMGFVCSCGLSRLSAEKQRSIRQTVGQEKALREEGRKDTGARDKVETLGNMRESSKSLRYWDSPGTWYVS